MARSLGRRDFVTGAAVVAGAAAAGGAALQTAGASEAQGSAAEVSTDVTLDYTSNHHPFAIAPVKLSDVSADKTLECDYLVVGCGVCGSTSAARAAEGGLKVIVLERTGILGGSALGTEAHFTLDSCKWVQEQHMVSWTPKEAYEYFMFYNNWRPDGTILMNWLQHCGEVFDWFISEGAVVADTMWGIEGEGTSVGLFFEGESAAIFDICHDIAERNGAEFYTNTPVDALVVDDDGAVVGALATAEDGSSLLVRSKRTFVGTGGFGCNDDMVAYYMGSRGSASAAWDKKISLCHYGDGINMMLGLGAVDGGLQYEVAAGCAVSDERVSADDSVSRTASEPGLWVNTFGARVGQSESLSPTPAFMLCQYAPGSRLFNILDADQIERIATVGTFSHTQYMPYSYDPVPTVAEDLDKAAEEGICFKADTLEELAEACGINEEALLSTIARYNELCAKGVDDDFDKSAETLLPVAKAPFYAFKLTPTRLSSMSGVKVNKDFQVLGADGSPIPNLYCGGLDSGGMFEANYNHVFSGSASSYSYYSGMSSADQAVAALIG